MSDWPLYAFLIALNIVMFGGPFIASLLKHQKEMAQIYQAQSASGDELRQLREEIRELKLIVLRQSTPVARDHAETPR